jgi:gluconolactonase
MSEPFVMEEVASGLGFPEGPIACEDGSVLLVEIRRGTLTRVQPDGSKEVVAECGGGPNGAAFGPDGAVYICNNGGFEWHDVAGLVLPGNQPASYSGGSIQRVDLASGKVETLYTECDGHPLRGPNDIVFDETGAFWFTDHGKTRERDRDRTGLFHARPDGSGIREVVHPLDGPNGVGLSPDGRRVIVAETWPGRLWAFALSAPGEIDEAAGTLGGPPGATLLVGLPGMQLFDSLAVDAEGNTCVATIGNGGITIVPPAGAELGVGTRHIPTGDPLTTNICFGGDDLRTAWITCSATGRLVRTLWDTPGLDLAFPK